MHSSLLRLTFSVLVCVVACPFLGWSGALASLSPILRGKSSAAILQQDEDPFAERKEKSGEEKKVESKKPEEKKSDENKSVESKKSFEPTKGSESGTAKESAKPNRETEKIPENLSGDENPFKSVSDENAALEREASAKPRSETTEKRTKTLNKTPSKTTTRKVASSGTSNQGLPGERTFEEKFWEYLKSNAYENWSPVPGESGGFVVGESPHGAFLKMYLNRTAAGNPEKLPSGSIIVKENYAVDRKTLKAITVMYRSKDYDPENGDWYWIKYNSDGSVARTSTKLGAKKMMGRHLGCINCHSEAAGGDYAFFND